MTTAEATVETLLAHGLNTVYALPGVHNDHLFDAFQRAGDCAARRARAARTGRSLYGAGRGAGDRQATALRGGAGPGPAQFRRGAAHRVFHERAGAGDDRPDSGRRYRPRARPSARNPRPGRDHQPAGRSFRPHRRARRSLGQDRQGDPRDGDRPARPGRARMRHGRLGQAREGRPDRAALAAAGAEDRRGCGAQGGEAPRRCQAHPHRRRRRRAGRVARSDAALQHAAGAGARLSARTRRARQPRSVQRDVAARPRPVGGGRRGARHRHQAVGAA